MSGDLFERLMKASLDLNEDHMNCTWDGQPTDPYIKQLLTDSSIAAAILREVADNIAERDGWTYNEGTWSHGDGRTFTW